MRHTTPNPIRKQNEFMPKSKYVGVQSPCDIFRANEKGPFWAFLDLNPPIRPTNIPQIQIMQKINM